MGQDRMPWHNSSSQGSLMIRPKHVRQALKDKVTQVVTENQGNMSEIKATTSRGYRLSPSPTVSHRISMHPGKGAGRRADRLTIQSLFSETKGLTTRLISAADASLTDKQRKAKYKVRDSELYDTQSMAKMGVKF